MRQVSQTGLCPKCGFHTADILDFLNDNYMLLRCRYCSHEWVAPPHAR
jgi:DNA-directed RNA polymerase subunit RPC12/RpoP